MAQWPRSRQYIENTRIEKVYARGEDWRIYELENYGRALVVTCKLARRWIKDRLLTDADLPYWQKRTRSCRYVADWDYSNLRPVREAVGGVGAYCSAEEVFEFADNLRKTRERLPRTSLHDALHVDCHSLLLPTYTKTQPQPDDVVFGQWLTGKRHQSVLALDEVLDSTYKLEKRELREAIRRAGLGDGTDDRAPAKPTERFRLPGRHDLEAFLNEQVVDIIRRPTGYERFGISFPGAMILHGLPGCGKTYAIEKLAEFLGWPVIRLDASTIGSPYIHETSMKIAKQFKEAEDSAPAMIIIDEMESYLADRQHELNTGLHHVEEVTEFLRRIPQAAEQKVLVVGMTNRVEMLDSAVTRRGRFDHIYHVAMPTATEIEELLMLHTKDLPLAPDVDLGEFAAVLAGRPPSDIAYLIRQAALVAAKQDLQCIDRSTVEQAMQRLATADHPAVSPGRPTPSTENGQPHVH